MNVDDFLNRIRSERARLDEVLSRIPDDSMTTAPDGGWSVKDQLAHLAAWQQMALMRLTGGDQDAVLGWTAEETRDKDIDAVNDRVFELNRDRSLEDVRGEFRGSFDQLCAAVERLDDAELTSLWLPGSPDRGTREQMIAANTFEHYEEHLPAFNALAEE
ncbi:MAG: DinB family protein [Actinomycetota bacterium]